MDNVTLPTIAEIRASTEVLSTPEAYAKVVRVGANVVVKYGRIVSLLEAENLAYVAKMSDVPVPALLGTLTEPDTGCNFIVMEFVPGQGLDQIWPTLTPTEKVELERLLRAALGELRRLADPGYLGSVGRQACADGVFWRPEYDVAVSGPFKCESAMNEGILLRLAETEPASHLKLLRTLISSTLYGHKTYFTHGDLQPKNIIVRRRTGAGNKASEPNDFPTLDVTIIDWEISGWYPEYWEFCNSSIAGAHRPHWLDLVQKIMPVYNHEYLMMQTIRRLLFF